MAELTPAQGRYLSYIYHYTQGFGVPPAGFEIAEALNVSSASVTQMLKTLEKKKLIRRDPNAPDRMEVLVDAKQIPNWKGARISRTIRGWLPAKSTTPAAKQTAVKPTKIYRFKITLVGSQPPIWRRIETEDVSLGGLHEQIQTAMGWTNSHLHQFDLYGKRYTDPRFMDEPFDDFGAADYTSIRLSELVSQHGSGLRMTYEYDFGDGWEHAVVLEKITEPEANQKYPRCTAGKRACPPEDIGGIYGYENYLDAISNPKHEEHEDYLEWHGPFDPEAFDPEQASKAMRKNLRRR